MLIDYYSTVIPSGVDVEPNPATPVWCLVWKAVLWRHCDKVEIGNSFSDWLFKGRSIIVVVVVFIIIPLFFFSTKSWEPLKKQEKDPVASIMRQSVTGSRNLHKLTANPGNSLWLHLGQRKSLSLMNTLEWFSASDILFLLDSYCNKSL